MDIKLDIIANELPHAVFPYQIILPLTSWQAMQTWCDQHIGDRGSEWEVQWAISYSNQQALFYFKDERARNLFILRWT